MIRLSTILFLLILSGPVCSISGSNGSYSAIIHYERGALPLIGIRINGGARYTNNRSIEVEIKSIKTDKSLIESMRIGLNPNLSGVEWRPYTEDVIKMTVSEGDGEKRVYVQLRDKAGNTSPIESNKIILDTQPPKNCKILINNGAKYTNDKLGRVLLNLSGDDVFQVMLSNSPNFPNGRWEPFKKSMKWIINVGGGDGEKMVYAKFKDHAGNESEPISTSIVLDLTPPTENSVVINNGEKYTRSRKLKLTVSSKDATKVRIVCRGVGKNYDFMPEADGKMIISWIVDSIQGPKTIKAYFMDEAKNTTRVPAEATIIYKSKPPVKPVIVVNQGKRFINHADGKVSLKINTRENPQGLKMLISNKPNFEGAKERPFNPVINSWQLDHQEDGLKTIYVRLIDVAGNISEPVKAEIFLDRTPPKVNLFTVNDKSQFCTSLKVTLTSDVDDAFEAQYSNNSNTVKTVKWEKYNPKRPDWTLLPGDGVKTVYARFRDEAGNVTGVVSSDITLDMTPPKGRLVINGGNKLTNHAEGVVKLQIEYDEDVVAMQISNKPDFENIEVKPIEKTIENWKVDPQGDGPKTIFLRLQDRAGNFSKIYTASILLDRTPPDNCEMVVNNNNLYVTNKNRKVVLSFRAEGAKYMMISNKPTMEGAEWIPFKTAVSWSLDGPEGEHYVHVKFKDAAGNESKVISKRVITDFTPPKVNKFEIKNDLKFCCDPQGRVTLDMDVDEAVMMVISNNPIKDTSQIRDLWEPYKNNREWKLEGEDGLKIVFSRFKDEAGNITPEYSARIVLDRMPPTDGKISVNNGAEWVTDKSGKCDIYLSVKEASEVQLSNTTDFSKAKWEPMTAVRKGWIVDTRKSSAQISARFRDKAGNVSEPVSVTVKIDIDPPKNPSIIIDGGAKFVSDKSRKIKLALKAEGATMMRVGRAKNLRDAKWEPLATEKEIVLSEPDGEKVFYAQFRDDAGNVTEIINSKIILDTTPPKISKFIINDGEEWTNNTEKKVTLNIDAEGATEMMVSSDPNFSNASWQPFKSKITDFILPGDDGEKILFLKLKDEPGNISRVARARINLKRSF